MIRLLIDRVANLDLMNNVITSIELYVSVTSYVYVCLIMLSEQEGKTALDLAREYRRKMDVSIILKVIYYIMLAQSIVLL